MSSCDVRRPSVNVCANRFFYQTNGWIAAKLAQTDLHPGCSQGQGRGQRSRKRDTLVVSAVAICRFSVFCYSLIN